MASGGHRNMIQGEQYQNQDVHLTVACLRARRSQLSPRDAFYQQIQPERYQLKSQDRKTHGILRKGESSLYSNTYNDVRCRINEEKAELKRRLQQVQRHEAEAEINRQKRAEQWRQLVVKEEREERERKKKIEKLQKLIDKEMKRAHHRHHADVNPTYLSTHIQNSHTEFSKLSLCSTATNKPPDRQDGAALKKGDSSNNTTEQPTIETAGAEQTSPSSISTDVDIVLNDDAATVDQVELATTVEVQDVAYVLMEDEETKTEDYPTECIDSAADRDNAEHLHTLLPYAEASKSAQQLSITEPPVQDTIAALITQPAAHKSGATPTVLQLTTEPQIQHNDDAVIRLEAKEESEATPTVQTTTDVTKTQQCNCKELQTQLDTAVRITQPAAHKSDATLPVQITTEPQIQPPDITVTTQPEANEESRATPTVQIITDSDTRSESHDTQFWYHLNNTDDIYRTPESMSRVFTCRHSDYNYVILYLLLYS